VSFFISSFRASALVTLVTLATGCGGGDMPADRSSDVSVGTEDARYLPALVDDEGLPMPAVAMIVPADAAAQTRDQRYASHLQADRLRSALGSSALTVDLLHDDAAAFDTVVAARADGATRGHRAVFVTASDLRLGAAFADRLATAGVENVWLVTQ
jgi:hypothetical protein